MTTTIICTIIISIIFFILLLIGIKKNWDFYVLIFLLWGYTLFLGLSISFYNNQYYYEKGQTDALKNKFDYKMEIKYIFNDSTYIPIDTLFTKIK